MTRKAFRSLVALQILLLLLAGTIAVAGKVTSRLKTAAEGGPSVEDFEDGFSRHLGKPYTEKMHSGVIGLIRESEETNAGLFGALESHGRVGFELGIAVGICSLVSLIIVFRQKPRSDA
jgi:hypothetical protein